MYFLGKSDKSDLIQHCIDVANKSEELARIVTSDEFIIKSAYISGLFHDLGKCVSYYQDLFLYNKSFGDKLRHNVISAYYCFNHLKLQNTGNEFDYNNIIKTILYHHDSIILINNISDIEEKYRQDINENDENSLKECFEQLLNICKSKYKDASENFTYKSPIDVTYFDGSTSYDITKNDVFIILSSIVINADILVSAKNELKLERKNTNIIFNKPLNYDYRFDIQKEKINELNNFNLSLFNSQTGFGKTMLGIMYLLSNNKKGYWICPQNSICIGVYKTIIKELKALKLNNISVALLLTGKYYYGNPDSDIIVTNIDNFSKPLFCCGDNDRRFDMIFCNAIFDEFHEFVDDAPIMSVFNLLLRARKKILNSKTLLLSATPTKNFYQFLIDTNNNKQNNIYNCEEILNRKLRIKFVDFDEVEYKDYRNTSTMVYCQSVSLAQQYFQNNLVDKIAHSRYTESDKNEIIESLINEHGKNSSSKSSCACTNVLTTAIDISFDNLLIFYPTPDRLIQSLGRCNRWNKSENIPLVELCIPNLNSECCALNTFYKKELVYDKKRNNGFYIFLKEKIKDNSIITFGELYKLRDEFYDTYKNEYNCFFNEKLNKSSKSSKKLHYTHGNSSDDTEQTVYISNKPSLRKNDDDIYNFFALFKNNNNVYMNEPIQVSTLIMGNDIDNYFNLHKMLKDIVNLGISKKYFKNGDAQIKKMLKSNKLTKSKEILIDKSICSDTPLLITDGFYYDKKLGIVKK